MALSATFNFSSFFVNLAQTVYTDWTIGAKDSLSLPLKIIDKEVGQAYPRRQHCL